MIYLFAGYQVYSGIPPDRTVMLRFCCVLFLLLSACDTSEDQDEFENQAFSEPSGFTRTSVSGEIQSKDDDDWRVSPAYFGRVVIDPAFPNPAPSGETVAIPVRVRLSNSVQGGLEITSYDANGIPRRLDSIPDARDPGSYVFRFLPRTLGVTGLVRVFIVDTQGGLVSYGDIQMNE